MERPGTSNAVGVLPAMWRLRWVVVLVTLLGAAAGWGIVSRQTPVYEARARLVLADPSTTTIYRPPVTQNAGRRLGNVQQRLGSEAVAARAAELLDTGEAPAALRGRIAVAAVEESDLVDVLATGPTGAEAAALADAVTQAYTEVAEDDLAQATDATAAELETTADGLRAALAELDAEVDAARAAAVAAAAADPAVIPGDVLEATQARLRADRALEAAEHERTRTRGELEELERRVRQIRIDAGLYGAGVAAVEPARVPGTPIAPQPRAAALLGAALGLFLSAALSAALATRRRGNEDPAAPARTLGVPLLAAVPAFGSAREAHTLPDPAAGAAEALAARAFGVAGSTLATALLRRGGKILLVSTPTPGEGASLTAFNLAAAVSGQGKRVVLLDPESLDEVAPGDSASGTLRLERLDDPAPAVAVATAVERLRREADLVVVDAPGLLTTPRASQVAQLADGLVLVIARGTPQDALERTRERIDLLGVPILGYVFNRARLDAAQAATPVGRGGGDPYQVDLRRARAVVRGG
jgi:Mrp family chromosome partitioning ATPase/capsular polysaccharide biosynthesis protein